MHKSRLAGFIIDCKTDDLPAAARFWGAALGMKVQCLTGEEGKYVKLQDERHGLHIETDDVEAEAARIEKLGARKVQKINTWWVMEAPTGQRFCIVRAKAPDFGEKSNRWK